MLERFFQRKERNFDKDVARVVKTGRFMGEIALEELAKQDKVEYKPLNEILRDTEYRLRVDQAANNILLPRIY